MKNKFIKSTIILIFGGAISKLLAMVIKIFLTRSIGKNGVSIYMMVLPTFNLFITLCTLSLSISVSKLIANHNSGKKIILPIIPISIVYNIGLMMILIFLTPIISYKLLNNSMTYYPIMSIAFTLPFICLSNILKGYFYGNENMVPFVVSNILEQIIRLLFIIFIIPKFVKINLIFAISSVVLINIVSEFASTICLILFIPNKKVSISDFKFNKKIFNDVMSVSLPSTGSRLIGSISYFLEPIILSFVMIKCGYSSNYITQEYGIITGYVEPLLFIPSFFTSAISTAILPVISRNYSRGNVIYSKSKLLQALGISFGIGILMTGIFLIFPKFLIMLIYGVNVGENYLKFMCPFFLLFYIQGPLTSYLQAVDMADKAMMGTLVGAVIKNILLIILPKFIGIWGFVVSSIVNIFYVTIQHIHYVKKSFQL